MDPLFLEDGYVVVGLLRTDLLLYMGPISLKTLVKVPRNWLQSTSHVISEDSQFSHPVLVACSNENRRGSASIESSNYSIFCLELLD